MVDSSVHSSGFVEQSRLFRLPWTGLARWIKSARPSKFEQENGRKPSPEELADGGYSTVMNFRIHWKCPDVISLWMLPFVEGEDWQPFRCACEWLMLPIADTLMRQSLAKEIDRALCYVNRRECEIIKCFRYWKSGDDTRRDWRQIWPH